MKKRKNSPRKTMLLFLLFLACSMVVGGLVGSMISIQQSTVREVLEFLGRQAIRYSGGAAAAVTVAGFAAAIAIYRRGRKMAMQWDGEDEVYIEEVEERLGMGFMTISVTMILVFCLSAMAFSQISSLTKETWQRILWPLFSMMATMVLLFTLERKFVELEKQINPEKRGDTFDFRFKKTWLESCDEQERAIIYKSSYRAFQAAQTAYPICWGGVMILSIAVDIGVVPYVVIGVLWLTQILAYYTEASRKHRR